MADNMNYNNFRITIKITFNFVCPSDFNSISIIIFWWMFGISEIIMCDIHFQTIVIASIGTGDEERNLINLDDNMKEFNSFEKHLILNGSGFPNQHPK